MKATILENLSFTKVENYKTQPIIVPHTTPLSKIISILQENNIYEVFILRGKGIHTITIRDILKASDISKMKASSLMYPVSKLVPNDSVEKAARFLNNFRLRAIPIMRRKTLEGVISSKSLCKHLLETKDLKEISINKIMKSSPITIKETSFLSKARNLMLTNSIDHLPVLGREKLTGILRSNQIVFSMLPKEGLEKGAFLGERTRFLDIKVSGLMDPNILVFEPKEKASEILKKMLELEKTYALIKLWNELQGIVTYRDFITLLTKEKIKDIPIYIVGLPNNAFEAELAKKKFLKGGKTLQNSFPKIEEIRSTIKYKKISEDKRKYEVNVLITLKGKIYTYTQTGWTLPAIFDQILNKMKRILTQKSKKKRKSLRNISEGI
jgi:CBS domain-containing protein